MRVGQVGENNMTGDIFRWCKLLWFIDESDIL